MTTSSKMSGICWRCVIARSPARNPGSGGMSRWNGSTITAASSWPCSASSASTVARSLYGATSTWSWIACGMPPESGIGAGNALGDFGVCDISA